MSATEITLTEEQTAQRDVFIDRLLQSTAGVFDIFTVYIGDKLGFYRQLANGPRHKPPARTRHPGSRGRHGCCKRSSLPATGRPRRSAG